MDAAYTQIGDFAEKFKGEGGHLHNWRPFQAGDPYNFDDLPDVSGGNSRYNPTVKRFTVADNQTQGTVGVVDDALDDAGVVTKVDEGEMLAVFAALRHPAALR